MEMEAINQIFISAEVTDRRVSSSTVSLAQTEALQMDEARWKQKIQETCNFLCKRHPQNAENQLLWGLQQNLLKNDWILFALLSVSVQEENTESFPHVSAFLNFFTSSVKGLLWSPRLHLFDKITVKIMVVLWNIVTI